MVVLYDEHGNALGILAGPLVSHSGPARLDLMGSDGANIVVPDWQEATARVAAMTKEHRTNLLRVAAGVPITWPPRPPKYSTMWDGCREPDPILPGGR